MVVFVGLVRPAPNSLLQITRSSRRFSISGNSRGGSILISRNGYSPFRHILRASLNSSSVSSSTLVERSEGQSEIIFLGTGTSEGIPRVSCLTNPVKTCPVRMQNLHSPANMWCAQKP
nr:putative hydrolase C777.06C [Ipomoea batatas]